MFRKHSRIIAAIALGFFTWTSGGLFSIANAAQLEAKKSKAMASAQPQKKAARPEERFSKITEELENTLADTKADVASKKARLTAGRDEIEKLDGEMRAQFAATERKLKAAKLPAAILERHYKFVKHYDDNLNELKGNIAKVEKAKDNAEAEAGLAKVHEHLKRVKAPSSHQKLDPNNLPHRNRVLQKREPRMKKEDFDKDLKKDKHAWKHQKRIQVASAGSLVGLLTSNSYNAVTLPTADDLAENPDVQFTPEIRAKALELGNNPVKIYEWVRNNIDYVPTWGSIQGASMTMQTKQGNAFDTASLLIALLRAAGIHARYNTGTIELPIDKVMNWVGGFTDPMSALDFMSSGGVPTTGLTENGVIKKARLEHVWVEAFINYIPSRGAKHVNGKGDTWIKLDPSYKQNKITQTVYDNAAFQSQSTATVTKVLSNQEIEIKQYPYLLGTLPYRTVVKGSTFSGIPDNLRHKLTFNIKKDTSDTAPLAISKTLPELAGKKITISYSPATSDDLAAINSYLPQPHADGTPLEPGELPQSLPGYLINLVPELRINGQVVASGAPIALGTIEIFTMTFYEPNVDDSIITNTITAGAYKALGLNLGKISDDQISNIESKLDLNKTKLQNSQFSDMTKDDVLGDLLHYTAASYLAEVQKRNSIPVKSMGIKVITLPSETLFSTRLNVATVWGAPQSVGPGGLHMDADRLLYVVKAIDGNNDKVKQFMLVTGPTSSELENAVPERIFSTPDHIVEGISTVKAQRIATDQGIPIYSIDQSNIATTLPQLQVGQDVIADIQEAVNAGKVVFVTQSNVTYNGWTGCGYIILNPETGAGAYMISDGLSGAAILTLVDMCMTFSAIGSFNAYEQWMGIYDYWINLYGLRWAPGMNPNDDCPLGIWSGAGGSFGGVLLSGGVFNGYYYVSCWSSNKSCWISTTCGGTGIGLGGGISVESIWIDNARSVSNLLGRSGYISGFAGKTLVGFGVGGSVSPGTSPAATYGVGFGAGYGYINGSCTTSTSFAFGGCN